MNMATLEAGKTPSCSISQSDEKILERQNLKNIGVSQVFTRGIKAIEDKEELKEKKKQFDSGQLNLGQLLQEIEEL